MYVYIYLYIYKISIYLSIYLSIYIYIYIHFSSSFCLPPNHASLREQIFAEDQYTFCPPTQKPMKSEIGPQVNFFKKDVNLFFGGNFPPKSSLKIRPKKPRIFERVAHAQLHSSTPHGRNP